MESRLDALEKRTPKTGRNSHKPPPGNSLGKRPKSLRPKSNKTSGGQPGHPGSTLEWSETVVDEPISVPAAIPTEPTTPAPKKSRAKQTKPTTEVMIKAPTLPKQMDELITVGQCRNIRLEEKLDTEIEQFVRDKKLSIEVLLEAFYLIANDDKELMDRALTLSGKRLQERKEAGKLRHIYAQMQKYK